MVGVLHQTVFLSNLFWQFTIYCFMFIEVYCSRSRTGTDYIGSEIHLRSDMRARIFDFDFGIQNTCSQNTPCEDLGPSSSPFPFQNGNSKFKIYRLCCGKDLPTYKAFALRN
jgi:hypothetical protein